MTDRIFKGIGQTRLYERIYRICKKDRVGSAYLFAGPRGSGKMSLALNFFAAMNCRTPLENGEACGECPACVKSRSFSHPNLFLIYAVPRNSGKDYSKDADPIALLSEKQYDDVRSTLDTFQADPYEGLQVPGASRILINSIRKLKKDLSLKSEEDGWQFVITYLAEQANVESFNSLLKILEEPPPRTTFILTTEKLYELPDTIKSRCQILNFNPVAETDIIEYLKTQKLSESDASLIARLSSGNIQKVNRHIHQGLSDEKSTFLSLWRNIMGGEFFSLHERGRDLGQLAKSDRTAFEDFFRMFIYWFRDAQTLESGLSPTSLILFQYQQELSKFVEFYPNLDYYELIRKTEQVIELSTKNLYIPALAGRFFTSVHRDLQTARRSTK